MSLTCELCGRSFPPPHWKPYPRFCSKVCRHAYLGALRRGTTGYTKSGNQYKHRLIAARKLGRPLRKEEVVAFEDGNRANLDPSNLLVFGTRGEFNTWRKTRVYV